MASNDIIERKSCDEPVNVLRAEVVAREVIRLELVSEMPKVINLIRGAKENGKKSCYFQGYMSAPTRIILEEAGYDLYGEDSDRVEISWENTYSEIADDESEVLRIAEEAGVRIVTLEEFRNRIERE